MSGEEVDYRVEYETEKIRLEKLWEAYEVQQETIDGLKERIGMLEAGIKERDDIIELMKKALDQRENRLKELENE